MKERRRCRCGRLQGDTQKAYTALMQTSYLTTKQLLSILAVTLAAILTSGCCNTPSPYYGSNYVYPAVAPTYVRTYNYPAYSPVVVHVNRPAWDGGCNPWVRPTYAMPASACYQPNWPRRGCPPPHVSPHQMQRIPCYGSARPGATFVNPPPRREICQSGWIGY